MRQGGNPVPTRLYRINIYINFYSTNDMYNQKEVEGGACVLTGIIVKLLIH